MDVLGMDGPDPHRFGRRRRVRPRLRRAPGPGRLPGVDPAGELLLQPVRDDLGRHRRDPAQHRRRAGPRASEGAAGVAEGDPDGAVPLVLTATSVKASRTVSPSPHGWSSLLRAAAPAPLLAAAPRARVRRAVHRRLPLGGRPRALRVRQARRAGPVQRAGGLRRRGRAAGEPQNFLIVGLGLAGERRPDDPDFTDVLPGEVGGNRTDTIILARIDPDNAQIQMVSFPRDLAVPHQRHRRAGPHQQRLRTGPPGPHRHDLARTSASRSTTTSRSTSPASSGSCRAVGGVPI